MWLATENGIFNLDNCMGITLEYDWGNDTWARLSIIGNNGYLLCVEDYKTKEEAQQVLRRITDALIETEDRLWLNGKEL